MKAIIGNRLISKLKPKSKPYDVRDSKLVGFLIRVNISGKMVYMCEYDRGKRMTLGSVNVLTPSQARDKVKDILADYRKGINPKTAVKIKWCSTLSSYLETEYIPWFKANNKSNKSLDNLKHFTKEFGSKPLSELSHILLDKWRTKRLQNNVKPATTNRNLSSLKAALSKAAEWGIIQTNPLSKLKLHKIDNYNKTRFLSKDEEIRLRTAIDTRERKLSQSRENANNWREKRGYPKFPDLNNFFFVDYIKPMILLSINTGMRRGEVLGLTWENINFSLATLTITGKIAKSGKTRHIPLNQEALNTLKNWQIQTGKTEGTVFFNKSGRQLVDIKKSWASLLKLAQIESFRWHDLRHHFASRLVMVGVDLNTVRELLGHSDIKMTLRYAHLAPEHKAAAVAKLIGF